MHANCSQPGVHVRSSPKTTGRFVVLFALRTHDALDDCHIRIQRPVFRSTTTTTPCDSHTLWPEKISNPDSAQSLTSGADYKIEQVEAILAELRTMIATCLIVLGFRCLPLCISNEFETIEFPKGTHIHWTLASYIA